MARTLKDYEKPVHDEDCEVYRNDGMTALAEHTVNQVMGEPRCTCGLAEVRRAIINQPPSKESEVTP